jgi:uncharacterized protein YjiS (DUF1127 family)
MRQIDHQLGFATLFSALAMAVGTAERTFAPVPAGHRSFERAASGLRRVADTLALWQQRAQGRRQLRTFDDHLLRDIGVTRLQAELEADKPFWRA